MLPPSLVEFLKQCKAWGLTFDEVAKKMDEQGWSLSFLEACREWYKQNAPEIYNTTPKSGQRGGSGLSFPFLAILIFLFLVLIATSTAAYLIATDKIDIGNNEFKEKIDNFVLKLPIVPKNPGVIFKLAAIAHENVSRSSLDFSFASASDDLNSTLGSNQLDLALRGHTDYSDVANPKFSLTGAINKEFNVDLRKNDHNLYVKFGKLPLSLTAVFGIRPSDMDKLLENWIVFDTSRLETEARKSLDEITMETPIQADTQVAQDIDSFLAEEILPNFIQSKDEFDGYPVYKLSLDPTNDQIDKFFELGSSSGNTSKSMLYAKEDTPKASEMFHNTNVSILIDHKDYYIRKIQISTVFDPNSLAQSRSLLPLENSFESPIRMSLVLKFSNFGEELPIDTPSESFTLEEFLEELFTVSPALSSFSSSGSSYLGNGNQASPFLPSLSSGFISSGPQLIETGATAHIESANVSGSEMIVRVTFTNTSASNVKVSPLRLRMISSASGSAPRPAVPLLELTPRQSQQYDFSYQYATGLPAQWVYLNSSGKSINLGNYQP